MTIRPILHPGDVGPSVAVLRQALAERGALPSLAASEAGFGPVLVGAVKTFQAKHQLLVDGVVGTSTWAALDAAPDADVGVPDPDFGAMTPFARMVLQVADEEWRAGVAEVPLGSNRGQRVDQYLAGHDGRADYLLQASHQAPTAADGWKGAPWCGRFAAWCITEAARRLGIPCPIDGWGDLASAVKWQARAHERGFLRSAPTPGCVALIIIPPAAPGADPHGHVTLVPNILGDGSVWTREGNSANRTAARHRQTSEFSGGFVDIGRLVA